MFQVPVLNSSVEKVFFKADQHCCMTSTCGIS